MNKELEQIILNALQECLKIMDSRILILQNIDYKDEQRVKTEFENLKEERLILNNIFMMSNRLKFQKSIDDYKNKYAEYDKYIKKIYYMILFFDQ